MLTYKIMMSDSTANDVVSRQLLIIIDGGTPIPQNIILNQTETQLEVPENSNIRLELRDTDDAGNISEPSVLEFEALDTLPPPKPGDMTVTLISEN